MLPVFRFCVILYLARKMRQCQCSARNARRATKRLRKQMRRGKFTYIKKRGPKTRAFCRQHLINFYLKKSKIREKRIFSKENLHIPTQNFVAARNFYGSKISKFKKYEVSASFCTLNQLSNSKTR